MWWNKNVIAGVAAAAVVIYLFAPGSVGAAWPLILFAVCPLAMLLMMRAMSGGHSKHAGVSDAAERRAIDDQLARLQTEVAELTRTKDDRRQNQ